MLNVINLTIFVHTRCFIFLALNINFTCTGIIIYIYKLNLKSCFYTIFVIYYIFTSFLDTVIYGTLKQNMKTAHFLLQFSKTKESCFYGVEFHAQSLNLDI